MLKKLVWRLKAMFTPSNQAVLAKLELNMKRLVRNQALKQRESHHCMVEISKQQGKIEAINKDYCEAGMMIRHLDNILNTVERG